MPFRPIRAPALLVCAAAALAAPAVAQTPSPAAVDSITVCVIDHGELRVIDATVDSATGDTLAGGRRFSEAHPATSPPYAEGADWFIGMEPILVGKGPYRRKTRYGLPRILEPGMVRRFGYYRGVPLFAEPEASRVSPEVVYVPVRPGCVFQPYQAAVTVGAVRG